MSGHSKWATIKHKKAATDAKRGRVFTRLIKEITIAARGGGGDPDSNPRLRTAVLAAKQASMPADNIKRAIQRGTGEGGGAQLEEITFEAYGPGGVALLVDVVTDNRNRAVSELRHIFSKQGGNLGEAGSVAWMFKKQGYIVVPKEKAGEDELMAGFQNEISVATHIRERFVGAGERLSPRICREQSHCAEQASDQRQEEDRLCFHRFHSFALTDRGPERLRPFRVDSHFPALAQFPSITS